MYLLFCNLLALGFIILICFFLINNCKLVPYICLVLYIFINEAERFLKNFTDTYLFSKDFYVLLCLIKEKFKEKLNK